MYLSCSLHGCSTLAAALAAAALGSTLATAVIATMAWNRYESIISELCKILPICADILRNHVKICLKRLANNPIILGYRRFLV